MKVGDAYGTNEGEVSAFLAEVLVSYSGHGRVAHDSR